MTSRPHPTLCRYPTGWPGTPLPLHPILRERLRVDEQLSDADFWKVWKSKTQRVCKPC